MDSPSRILVAPLRRERGRTVALRAAPPKPEREPVRRPAKAARTLALAHHIQRAIDAGKLADQADPARRFGLTRARITQVLDLLLLAPDIQEAVLLAEAVDGQEPWTERRLRPIAAKRSWADQRAMWARATTPTERSSRRPRSE